MTAQEYPALAMSTAPNLGSAAKNITHASLGLISEVGEMADMLKRSLAYGKAFDPVNLVEESGDVLWYVVLLCTQTDHDFEMLLPRALYACDPIDMMVEDLAQFAGIVATRARQCEMHGMKHTYTNELRRIVTTVEKICRAAGYSIETAMDRNIAKLARRYPEGFTEWRALNRDLVGERKVLEGGPQQL